MTSARPAVRQLAGQPARVTAQSPPYYARRSPRFLDRAASSIALGNPERLADALGVNATLLIVQEPKGSAGKRP